MNKRKKEGESNEIRTFDTALKEYRTLRNAIIPSYHIIEKNNNYKTIIICTYYLVFPSIIRK